MVNQFLTNWKLVMNGSFFLKNINIQGFRGFLRPQAVSFDEKKSSLAIFAKNRIGKSSFVDAFDFILSERGELSHFLDRTDGLDEKDDPETLLNCNQEGNIKSSFVEMGFILGKEEHNVIRKVGKLTKKTPNAIEMLRPHLQINPIIRGYELRAFAENRNSRLRFNFIAKWIRIEKNVTALEEVRKTRTQLNLDQKIDTNSKLLESYADHLKSLTGLERRNLTDINVLSFINKKLLGKHTHDLQLLKIASERVTRLELEKLVSKAKMSGQTKQLNQIFGNMKKILELKYIYDLTKQIVESSKKFKLDLIGREKIVSAELSKNLKGMLNRIESQMNEIYNNVQKNSDSENLKIHLKLEINKVSKQHEIKILIDFAPNRKRVKPSSYLSDSQMHTLALAFRVAAIHELNEKIRFLVLDDIFTSYDMENRRNLIQFIDELSKEFQVIVTSHDRLFIRYLKGLATRDNWNYQDLIRSENDFGTRFEKYVPEEPHIKKLWEMGLSAANEIRIVQESWLFKICDALKIEIKRIPSKKPHTYYRKDLMQEFYNFIKSCHIEEVVKNEIPELTKKLLNAIIENEGSHATDEEGLPPSQGDEESLWKDFCKLQKFFICSECNSNSKYNYPNIYYYPKFDKMFCRHCNKEHKFKLPQLT